MYRMKKHILNRIVVFCVFASSAFLFVVTLYTECPVLAGPDDFSPAGIPNYKMATAITATTTTNAATAIGAKRCLSLPKLHIADSTSPNNKLLLDSYNEAYSKSWHPPQMDWEPPPPISTNEKINNNNERSYDDDMFTTIKDGTFILWSFGNGIKIEMSAYNNDEVIEGMQKNYFQWDFVDPSKKNLNSIINNPQKSKKIQGDYVAFISIFPGNFAHFLTDHLPYLGFLVEHFPSSMKFILADTDGQNRKRLEIINPEFTKNRVEWIDCDKNHQCDSMLQIDGNLILLTKMVTTRHIDLFEISRDWVLKSYPPPKQLKQEEKTILYYSRNSANAFHARAMEPTLETQIIKQIESSMTKYNRAEKLVIFNGSDPFEEQINLFRTATTIIGPHGGGFANLIWSLPSSVCEDRPKVIEFLKCKGTDSVQAGTNFFKTYYFLLSGSPWLSYHHLCYVPPSTHTTLYINLDDLQAALDSLWGTEKPVVWHPKGWNTNTSKHKREN